MFFAIACTNVHGLFFGAAPASRRACSVALFSGAGGRRVTAAN